LRGAALDACRDTANELLLSAASGWEIAIKHRIGKLPLPTGPATYVPDRLRSSGTVPLPVAMEHVLRVASLPDHHRDPFDRLLVAQAQVESLTLISTDAKIAAYDVALLPA
jgi:PIN domain nuclease of toxin-antitoxin system